jgi:hypothetical protein
MPAREFITRHAAAVLQRLDERYGQLKQQFDAVDAIDYHPSFDRACGAVKVTLAAMLEAPTLRRDGEIVRQASTTGI